MSLRIPTRVPISPTDRATCELVFETLVQHGPVIDNAALQRACHDDPALMRYARDTLSLFAQLDQVDHVRRNLWVIRPDPGTSTRRIEMTRLDAASRALGDWVVAAGTWALELHGIRLAHLPRDSVVRFALTTRRARPATYADTARATNANRLPGGANEARHVTVLLDEPVAAVTRPTSRLGHGTWHCVDSCGGHVLDVSDAFISLVEHPRLSGGCDSARHAALPVIATVGIDPILERGRLHPVLAVRRRLAFVLMEAVTRTSRAVSWIGPDATGRIDDGSERWRIARTLGVADRRRGHPTVLDPHRVPSGPVDPRLHVLDNRGAPVAPRLRVGTGAGTAADAEAGAGAGRDIARKSGE